MDGWRFELGKCIDMNNLGIEDDGGLPEFKYDMQGEKFMPDDVNTKVDLSSLKMAQPVK